MAGLRHCRPKGCRHSRLQAGPLLGAGGGQQAPQGHRVFTWLGRQLAQQGRQGLGRLGQGLLDGDGDQLAIVARRPPGQRARGAEQGQQLQVAIADYRPGFGVSWVRRLGRRRSLH